MLTLRHRPPSHHASTEVADGGRTPPPAWLRLGDSGRFGVVTAAAALAIGTAPAFLCTFVNDDATYALVAQKLNSGALLYRQAVDNKPPLIYATFAAMLGIFGPGALVAMKVATVIAQLVCALLVRALGHRLCGARAGTLAAVLFSLASVSGLTKDVAAPNTEIFANPFILGALVLLARDVERPSRRALTGAGLLLGMATLYRLPAAVALVGVWFFLSAGSLPRLPRLYAALRLTAGFLVPLVVAAGYFGARGTARDLWLWAVRGNLSYVGVGEAQLGLLALVRVALMVAGQFPLLFVATRVGLLWRATREPHRTPLRFLFLQLLTALFAYRTGSRFYGHYFQQVVPFLALIGAWGLLNLPPRDQRWLRFVPAVMIAVLAVFLGVNVVRARNQPTDRGLAEIIATVRAESGPNDEVLLWSAPPEIALQGGRPFATPFPFNNYLTGRVFGTRYVLPNTTRASTRPFENREAWRLFQATLAAAPPAFIVDGDSAQFAIGTYPELAPFLSAHYRPARTVGGLTVYSRVAAAREASPRRAHHAASAGTSAAQTTADSW